MTPSTQWEDSPLNGVAVFTPPIFADERGAFVKTFHEGLFVEKGISFSTREEFYTTSRKNVIRGMHFQVPPHHHAKLVTCLCGEILDVVLDLRRTEPTFGNGWAVALSAQNRRVLYIPEGFAHGFLALSDDSLVHYKTTTVHSPEHDRGILWNSFGFHWPVDAPIISNRDSKFPKLEDFDSPF